MRKPCRAAATFGNTKSRGSEGSDQNGIITADWPTLHGLPNFNLRENCDEEVSYCCCSSARNRLFFDRRRRCPALGRTSRRTSWRTSWWTSRRALGRPPRRALGRPPRRVLGRISWQTPRHCLYPVGLLRLVKQCDWPAHRGRVTICPSARKNVQWGALPAPFCDSIYQRTQKHGAGEGFFYGGTVTRGLSRDRSKPGEFPTSPG